MSYFTKSVKFLIAFQLKLLAFSVFLLLFLSFCYGKNVTVKVIGQIHCQYCIRHEFSSRQASLGINVFIHCKSREIETNTQGKGSVDREGKFNVTLSIESTKEGYSIESCFAKLQSQSTLPCPIRSAQTASVKILSTEHNTINRQMILKFSPVTCQSAFFLPRHKFTFFHTLQPIQGPPMGHAPRPSEALPPLFLPENSIPPPAPALAPLYLPPTPAPTFQRPQNPPFESPSPSPSPIYITPPQITPSNEPIPPPFSKQLPKPPRHSKNPPPPLKAFHRTPFVPIPILPPIPPPHHKEPHSEAPTAPPIPVLKPPTPFIPTLSPVPSPGTYPHPSLPKVEQPTPPPATRKRSNPIPRAPPVPQLPPISPVPRKYFNPPNSKSQPPHSS